jgi:O-antigen/teichoic acid export membrane protein
MTQSSDSVPDNSSALLSPTALVSRLARNTGLLATSRILSRTIGMGLTIVLARYLGAAEYGMYQRSEAFVFLFSIVASMGLDIILTREVARSNDQATPLFSAVLVTKVVLSVIAYLTINAAAELRGYEGNILWGIRLFGLVLIVNAMALSVDAVLQGLQAMRSLALVTVIGQLAWTIGALLCVVSGKDFLWIIGGLLLGSIVHLVISASIVRRRFHLKWKRPEGSTIRFLLKEAAPLAFAASFVILYQQIDAVMLGDLKGNSEVGWYRAAAKILLIFTILRESFMLAVFPVFSTLAKEAPGRLGSVFTGAVRYQLITALLFVIILSMFGRIAVHIFGTDFGSTARVLPIMVWIVVPQIISITSGRMLIATGHHRWLMLTAGCSLVVNVVGNLILIPKYSYMGAASASLVSESVIAGLNVLILNRLVCKTSLLKAVAKPVLAAALTGLIILPLSGLTMFFVIPIIVVIYAGCIIVLRVFTPAEIKQMRALVLELASRLQGGPPPPGTGSDSPDLDKGEFLE